MRVAVIPSDQGGTGYLRLAWPAWAVAEQTDWQVDVYDPSTVGLSADLQLRGINDVEALDLVVIQRVNSPRQVEMIRALQNLGIAVVIDIDDLLSEVDRRNSSWSKWNEKVEGVPRHEFLYSAAYRADIVTTSTPFLAQHYAQHGRSAVIRNGLPDHAYGGQRTATQDGTVTLGWSGMVASHPADLEVVGGAVRAAMDADPLLRFHVVGPAQGVASALSLDPDRVTATGFLPLDEYHAALRAVDLAIVPLADTRFNRAKSHLKALEFTAAGAMVLASDLPEQRNLSRWLPLVLPTAQGDWQASIEGTVRYLREDPERAAETSAMTSALSQHWSISNRVSEWADAWDRAVNRRRNFTN